MDIVIIQKVTVNKFKKKCPVQIMHTSCIDEKYNWKLNVQESIERE